jgi:hypothetical protein
VISNVRCTTHFFDGRPFCHDEGLHPWGEYVSWLKRDTNGDLMCKCNMHNCYKMKLKWFASLSSKEQEKYRKSCANYTTEK